MRPLIGIPLRYDESKKGTSLAYLFDTERLPLQTLGADILPIPPVIEVNNKETRLRDYPELSKENIKSLNRYLDNCDGIMLTGGMKILPSDRYILEYAIEHKIPILGICLGMQTMSCYQDELLMEKNPEEGINHNQKESEKYKHKVKILKDSLLYRIIGREEIEVNSFHNYHATQNKYYRAVAYSEDGLIEGIEYPSKTFNLGIQWHPEKSFDFDESSKKILKYFLNECENYQIFKNEKIRQSN